MKEYLQSTEIIDWQHPAVLALAQTLEQNRSNKIDVARACFEWVRDEILHSNDAGIQKLTCKASDVLISGTGVCYAKSHLLAALLRANGIPAALCYQRLTYDHDRSKFCLHGLIAVYLPDIGWYRIDARGNKPGVDAQFTPPVEKLAFPLSYPGEADYPEIYADPLPIVIEKLTRCKTVDDAWEQLPDMADTE